MPVRRKSSRTSSVCRVVSPTTSPGSSPRSDSGSGRTAARRPARSDPAVRWSSDGDVTSVGGPRAANTAASSSPLSAGWSRPRARTCWLGSRSAQGPSGARTRTGLATSDVRPPARTCSTRPFRTTNVDLPNPRHDPVRTAGSLVTTSVTSAASSRPAATATGPAEVDHTRAPVTPAAAAAPSAAAATVDDQRPPRASASSATKASATPSPMVNRVGRLSVTAAVTHAASAGTASRRSGRRDAVTRSPGRPSLRTSGPRSR